MKFQVLKASTKLKKLKGWDKVYIGPDRTKRESNEDRQLREELKKRRSKGENNLIIRSGKIVTREED